MQCEYIRWVHTKHQLLENGFMLLTIKMHFVNEHSGSGSVPVNGLVNGAQNEIFLELSTPLSCYTHII